MVFIIWLDDKGEEVRREKKGRGRPPKGTEKRDDGNFYVQPSTVDDTIYYVTTDTDGKVISKTPKGRGRPKPGFEKAADGHWYQSKISPVKT